MLGLPAQFELFLAVSHNCRTIELAAVTSYQVVLHDALPKAKVVIDTKSINEKIAHT